MIFYFGQNIDIWNSVEGGDGLAFELRSQQETKPLKFKEKATSVVEL